MEKPDGIIITISREILKENGYRHWLKNFLRCMDQDDCIYRFRVGNKPRFEVLYVYLLIGGKIRYRANLVSYDPPGYFISNAGNSLWGNCWIVICGPLVRAPEIIRRKGFQGFRYTEELF